MPYFLEGDEFAVLPVWEVLASGKADLMDRLQAAYIRLKATAAHTKSNGYLTAGTALAQCRGMSRTLELLCTPVLAQPPLVHRQGDECECLGPDPWIDGYGVRIHAFLKRNPARKETERRAAQDRDLNDTRLKRIVWVRDGGCCRYCRSGPLSPKAGRSKDRRKILHFDHVDPDAVAGPEGANLVVACARCNEDKGKCTPDEADMILLPAPTAEEAGAWSARPRTLYDRPAAQVPAAPSGSASDQPANNPGTAAEQGTDQISDQTTVDDPNNGPPIGLINDPGTPVHHHDDHHQAEQPRDAGPGGSGSGRVGNPLLVQPARTADYPDIYHGRSRAAPTPPAPTHPAGPDRQPLAAHPGSTP